MAAAFDPMPVPDRRKNRMLLLVCGTGAATGLHVGLLHLAIAHAFDSAEPKSAFHALVAVLVFFVGGLVFSAATYALWRWVFPYLRARTLAQQIALETVVSLIAIAIVSLLTVELSPILSGPPSLFSAPNGPGRSL